MTNVCILPILLFQSKNRQGSKFTHGRSWKNEYGHNVNQHALRRRHAKNIQLIAYRLAGTINIRKDMDEAEIQKTWAKITRVLREAGVVFWWTREVSRRSNRVHYHTIHTSHHTGDELKALIKKACPHLSFRLQFDPVKKAEWWANYICKSTEFGKDRESFHKAKVVLFADACKLAKHGTVGDFWKYTPKKPTKEENAKRRERTHRLKEAFNDSSVELAADFLAAKTGVQADELQRQLARELVTDPNSYQRVVDLATQQLAVWHFTETRRKPRLNRRIVGPFRFTAAPPPRTPPVRTKPQPPKPKVPFDPAKCVSFTP